MNIELVTRQPDAKTAGEMMDHPDLCPVPQVAQSVKERGGGGALLLIGYTLSNYSSRVGYVDHSLKQWLSLQSGTHTHMHACTHTTEGEVSQNNTWHSTWDSF